MISLWWRHNERDCVSNHQPDDCLLNRLFRRRSKNSSASLAFVGGIHRSPVNSPHNRPVTRKKFPFDDVIMIPSGYIRFVFDGVMAFMSAAFVHIVLIVFRCASLPFHQLRSYIWYTADCYTHNQIKDIAQYLVMPLRRSTHPVCRWNVFTNHRPAAVCNLNCGRAN